MSELAGCGRVLCESMHGAIFADAYGIPWRPVSGSSLGIEKSTHAFKWTDWTASVGLGFDSVRIIGLPEPQASLRSRLNARVNIEVVAGLLSRADREDRYGLSERAVLSARQDRLLDLADCLRADVLAEAGDATS